jgi:hypothetical protein
LSIIAEIQACISRKANSLLHEVPETLRDVKQVHLAPSVLRHRRTRHNALFSKS